MKLFIRHPETGGVIAVIPGTKGYWPIETRLCPDELNIKPLPEDVIDSALAASMFGWQTPAAMRVISWMYSERFDEEFEDAI